MGITKGLLDYLGARCKRHGIQGPVPALSRLETYFDFDIPLQGGYVDNPEWRQGTAGA